MLPHKLVGSDFFNDAWIEEYDLPEGTRFSLSGGYGDIESSSITLDARQALALLAHLSSIKEHLEETATKEINT